VKCSQDIEISSVSLYLWTAVGEVSAYCPAGPSGTEHLPIEEANLKAVSS
jgi:hypothetical protein